MTPSLSAPAAPFPASACSLEEVAAARPRDMAAALVFALGRSANDDGRMIVLALRTAWLAENGRPSPIGLAAAGLTDAGGRLLLVTPRTDADCLWVMEQALRSGAAGLVLGTVEQPTLPQTRRLDFAARDGGAVGLLLRGHGEGLSAARRRWTVTAAAGARDADDLRAAGGFRLVAELTRSRLERPGAWMLEQDDETHRLRLADRLAGDGLVQIGRTARAA